VKRQRITAPVTRAVTTIEEEREGVRRRVEVREVGGVVGGEVEARRMYPGVRMFIGVRVIDGMLDGSLVDRSDGL